MSYRPKIVITDDEVRMTESMRTLLGDRGYDIETFQSGRDALDHLRANECDLVLMDVMMPVMDGFEALSHIKNHHPEVSVIMMTGQASIDSAIRALRGGAYDYLCKPFEYDELIKKVDNALSHRRLSYEKNLIHHQLQWTEARYQYLVHHSPDIIFTLGPQNKFVFITDKIKNCTGLNGQNLMGKSFTSIVYHQDVDKVSRYLKEVRSGKTTKELLELRLKCESCSHNGTPCSGAHPIMELKAASMSNGITAGNGERPSEIYGIIRDVTQRKRNEEEKRALERQLRQAQKMEAIGTLAGGIAHDFNNLLMAIQGNISMMLMHCDPSNAHYERLKKIERYIENGSKLTSQLLGYARKGKYDVKPLDLNRIIEDTVQTFERMKKEIRFYLALAPDLEPIDADASQLQQVLMNLFLNAADAMPGGGSITVKSGTVDHDTIKPGLYKPKPGPYVLMSIRDTGIGMDEKTRERIFEPFFTTKEMGRGTGLGLASVYGIVKGHQGFIEVDSAIHGGTTFRVYMPVSEHPISQTTAPASETVLRGDGTILLIDDEEGILEIGKFMLEQMGYETLTSRTGEEALACYESHRDRIKLVLLDMIMPGMNGGKIYDRIKLINPGAKVLLISGYSLEGEAREILRRGCNGFIQKPFKIKELSRKIREITGPQPAPPTS
ncbi:MAG: response regulator [Syntrophales bacterium]|jgi:PAS domain S-box-containing protein|nr:response regulator [Syntrophales bacterium]